MATHSGGTADPEVRRLGHRANRRKGTANRLADLADHPPDDLTPEAWDALGAAAAAVVATLPRPTERQVETVGRLLRRAEEARALTDAR
jgi:hypothetical protein